MRGVDERLCEGGNKGCVIKKRRAVLWGWD